MGRIGTSVILAILTLLALPRLAAAGGPEFPASGTRALGRGASGFTRADDPNVMLRNPALLADMWDDQAMLGAHLLIADSCFHATGGYDQNAALGSQQIRIGNANVPQSTFLKDPYPNVCYQGPVPILPSLALTKKLSRDFGVGLGFFPPDTAQLSQFGNSDGTVNTPNGLRPSPTRYFGSHLDSSYFSALGAAGYRLADWIRIGAGFQWTALAISGTAWNRANPNLNPRDDVRTDFFMRDLFIPGVIASVHIVPTENLDFALGFKWSDRIQGKMKLDLTTGAFGTGVNDVDAAGHPVAHTGVTPFTSANQPAQLSAPPIWAPQLTFGARYARRLSPRVTNKNWDQAHVAAGRTVEDHMQTERFDVEFNAIVYFDSVYDQSWTSASEAAATVKNTPVGGFPSNFHVGFCTLFDASHNCIGVRRDRTLVHGKDQISLRLGGDYNILPGLFTVRGGVSYESSGQDVQYFNPRSYMLGRTGLHAGFTVRISGKTDFSVAFAHFIQPDVRLEPNPAAPGQAFSTHYANTTADPTRAATYNYHPNAKNDGIGKLPIPYSQGSNPDFANVGSYFYHLQVVSVTLAQHF